MGQELFETYPAFVQSSNGKLLPLRNISKRFCSLEEFFFHYSTLIGHSAEKHSEIIELLKWGKENGHITYGLLEFCASRK